MNLRKHCRCLSSGQTEGGRQPVKLKQDADYWFSDGSIILLDTGNIGYKIHATLLSRHSQFFSDMLSADDFRFKFIYFGVDVIVLDGDRSRDVKAFLRLIYGPSLYDDLFFSIFEYSE